MKAKTLLTFCMGIFALVLALSLTSAVIVNNTGYTNSTSADTGQFTVTFDLYSQNATNTTNVVYDVSGTSMANLAISSVSPSSVSNNSMISVSAVVSFNTSYEGTITGSITATPDSTSADSTSQFSVNITESEVPETCEVSNGGDLKVSIEDISVDGFGDEDLWYLYDVVTIEVDVENSGSEDIEDVEISWGLWDKDSKEFVIDGEESKIDIDEDDEETIDIEITLDDNIDDYDKSGRYVLYVWATGEVQNDDNDDTCIGDSEDIDVEIMNDFVILGDLKFTAQPSLCGQTVTLTADVANIGSKDQDDVIVTVFNKALGIDEELEIGDIDSLDTEKLNFEYVVPKDIEEKRYYLLLSVLDEDNDVYESDDDDNSDFDILLEVSGNCEVTPTAAVSASLEEGGKAGEQLVIEATITNTDTEKQEFEVGVSGFGQWAELDSISPEKVILAAGESTNILITLNVAEDASGEQILNIELIANNKLAVSQPVTVEMTEAGLNWSSLFQGKGLLWTIGIFNIVLILVIVIVALKLSKQ